MKLDFNVFERNGELPFHEKIVSEVSAEFLHGILEEVKNDSYYEPIIKEGYGEDWAYDEVEYFETLKGEEVEGWLIYASKQFDKATISGDLELIKQIFLTNKGQFFIYFTVYENRYCEECDQTHSTIHRVLAEDQKLNLKETKSILNEILCTIGDFPVF